MSWISIFKLYNTRKLKKENKLIIGICISVFLTTLISTTIPLIEKSFENNNINLAKELNGGDLKILYDYKSMEFNEELNKIKDEGYYINEYEILSGSFWKDTKKLLARVYVGNYKLKDDEIIIYKSIAKAFNLKIGDKIDLTIEGKSKKSYIIKDIENNPKMIDNDGELLGYGKINGDPSSNASRLGNILIINGEDIDSIYNRLADIEENYTYSTVSDSKVILDEKNKLQTSILSILSIFGYILTTFAIFSTIMVIIIKRKKDIAIMKLINITSSSIRKAIFFELSIMFIIPIILAVLLSDPTTKSILKYFNIYDYRSFLDTFIICGKSLILNCVCFSLFSIFMLKSIDNIKPILLIRTDKDVDILSMNMLKKASIIILLLSILITVFLIGIDSILSFLVIVLILGGLFLLCFCIITLLTNIKYKKKVLIYQINALKDSKVNILLIISSISFSVILILFALNFNSILLNSFEKNTEEKLTYNYYVSTSENITKNNISNIKEISAFRENYGRLNEETEFNNVTFKIANKNNYDLKLNIVLGEDLFEGNSGILISKKLSNILDVSVGDKLNIFIEESNQDFIIKGIYEDAGVNSLDIYTDIDTMNYIPNKIVYLINSESDEFLDEMNDSFFVKVNELGDSYTNMLKRYTELLGMLSILSIISSIILSINLSYVTSKIEEKNKMILKYISLDNRFFSRCLCLKILIEFFITSIISLTLYYILNNLIISMILKSSANISIRDMILGLILNLSLIIIVNIYDFFSVYKNSDSKILKE